MPNVGLGTHSHNILTIYIYTVMGAPQSLSFSLLGGSPLHGQHGLYQVGSNTICHDRNTKKKKNYS